MTGVGGKGRGAFCNLSSVFCLLVTETPDSFTGEACGGGMFSLVGSSAEPLATVFCALATCLLLALQQRRAT